MRVLAFVWCLLMGLALFGCSETLDESKVSTRFDVGYYQVTRFVDGEAGVVCWMVYYNGISCLPLSETTLP